MVAEVPDGVDLDGVEYTLDQLKAMDAMFRGKGYAQYLRQFAGMQSEVVVGSLGSPLCKELAEYSEASGVWACIQALRDFRNDVAEALKQYEQVVGTGE